MKSIRAAKSYCWMRTVTPSFWRSCWIREAVRSLSAPAEVTSTSSSSNGKPSSSSICFALSGSYQTSMFSLKYGLIGEIGVTICWPSPWSREFTSTSRLIAMLNAWRAVWVI